MYQRGSSQHFTSTNSKDVVLDTVMENTLVQNEDELYDNPRLESSPTAWKYGHEDMRSISSTTCRSAQGDASVEQNKLTSSELWQCAWSLVLRCYLGSDTINFCYKEGQSSTSGEGSKPTESVVDTVISGADKISDVVKDIDSAVKSTIHGTCSCSRVGKTVESGEENCLGKSLLFLRHGRIDDMPSGGWVPKTKGEQRMIRAVSKHLGPRI